MPVSVWRSTRQPRLPSRMGASRVAHAARWGHFASLVRSNASQFERLPAVRRRRISPQSPDCLRVRQLSGPPPCAKPFSWRARSSLRWHVCVLASASVVTPPPLIRRGPRCATYPPLRCAWLCRDASLRQSPPSRRRLPHRGGVFAPAPFPPRVRSPASRDAVSSRRKRSVPLAPAPACFGIAERSAPYPAHGWRALRRMRERGRARRSPPPTEAQR